MLLVEEYMGVDMAGLSDDELNRLMDRVAHSKSSMAINKTVRGGMLVEIKMEIIKRACGREVEA